MERDEGSWLSLCGITMSGTLTPDQGIKFLDLTGWWGMPAARGRADTIPGNHGQYRRAEILREGSTMTILGEFRADTNAELKAARDRLTTALAAGQGPMVLSTPNDGIWERHVEIERFDPKPDHGRTVSTFTIDLVSPDPRRYGPLQKVGPVSLPTVEGGVRFPQRTPLNFGRVSEASRLVVPNAGAIDLHPRLLLSGGFSEVTVTDITDGRSLRLEWPVAEDEVLTFDQGPRRAELSGQELTRWMSRRQWFVVPPGETHEFRFEVAGAVGDPQMWAEYKIGAW